MVEVTLWILIAVSSGSHNSGNSTVIDRFSSETACRATLVQLYEEAWSKSNSSWAKCVKATVVRESATKP